MQTHTPGPWRLVNDADGGSVSVFRALDETVGSRNNYAVAELIQNDSDARLIAAAPDMLETLKWAEKCFTNYLYPQSAEEADYYLKDAENALNAISAAIAKATGRSA